MKIISIALFTALFATAAGAGTGHHTTDHLHLLPAVLRTSVVWPILWLLLPLVFRVLMIMIAHLVWNAAAATSIVLVAHLMNAKRIAAVMNAIQWDKDARPVSLFADFQPRGDCGPCIPEPRDSRN